MTRIAIIIGSTRPGRRSTTVAEWVLERARARDGGAEYELLDIADFDLPHLDEEVPPIRGEYARDHTRAWAAAVLGYDAFVFVTPEYNHSTSGALKNAIDFLFAEWNDKACGFVSYGVEGGQRAIEHLRLIAGELRMADVRTSVSLTLGQHITQTGIDADETRLRKLGAMLDEVEAWSQALAGLRSASPA